MSLPGNEFLIQMHAGPRFYIGVDERGIILPFNVIALPGGTAAPKWKIQNFGESRYVITQGALGTRAEGARVVALKTQTPLQWQLTWFPQQGPHCYMITDGYPGPTQGFAWTVEPDTPYGRVVLKDVGPFAPELPPQEALFNLVHVPEAKAEGKAEAEAAPAA
ncbi:serine protease inhibitor [Phanerochaete sordida]|uniref:Serine protease inhibitor n=1 Tax=Phanerochaete sordida TaxID=48140 RepID=A0A9P3L938_9APHY|nr:serine protease inhibitor [Phanerochaete sordida]